MLNITKKDVVVIGSVVFGITGFAYGYICEKKLKECIRANRFKYNVKYTSYYDKNCHMYHEAGESSNLVKKIVFDNLCDARKILSEMENYIKIYRDASVSDYYQLVGVECNAIDFNFGWRDLKNTKVVYDGYVKGYVIDFPKVVPLE